MIALRPRAGVLEVRLCDRPHLNQNSGSSRAAINDWLQNRDQRMVLLRQAGVFANDETLEELQAQIDRDRKTSKLRLDDFKS